MTGEQLRRAEIVFDRLVDLPPDRRFAALDAECGADSELRQLVAQLLESDGSAGQGFLLTPVLPLPRAGESAVIPRRVGRYEVLRLIGEGGMGIVYEAQQERPRRRVALKVIRPERATRTLLSRFRYEAEVLARLQHPGIAHVYEAATAEMEFETGAKIVIPFFAMELIQGRPLMSYAGEERLNDRQKLELFSRVCDAVGYAHQRGVIHRDLKPNNILVTVNDPPMSHDSGDRRARGAHPGKTSPSSRRGFAENS